MPLTSVIMPYDPEWPIRFEQEAARLRSVFATTLIDIHHIGSTAVPGLAAKPEIDILVIHDEAPMSVSTEQLLKDLGYRRGGDLMPGHHFFKRDVDGARTHKLHVMTAAHPKIVHLLTFRDRLRSDHALRIEYEQLKRRLERENTGGIGEYLNGKAPFIDAAVDGEKRP